MERTGLRYVAGLLAIGMLWLPLAASAQQDAAGFKIGIVDRKQVFDNYKKQQDEYARLQTEVEQLQKQIEDLAAQVKTKKDAFDAEKDRLSEEERRTRAEEVENLFRKYRSEYELLQGQIDSKHARLIEDMKAEINLAIAEIGDQEGYHLILDGDSDPKSRTSVLYFSSTLNMTGKVTEYLNAKYANNRSRR